MERVLSLDEKANRMRIRLRLDGGFGSDENINFALSRGYGLLIKMYSGNRARVLAKSVEKWVAAPTKRQREKGENATREAAFLTKPHRYCRKTQQVAIRTPNPKNKSGYSYRVIVTTDPDDCNHTITMNAGAYPRTSSARIIRDLQRENDANSAFSPNRR